MLVEIEESVKLKGHPCWHFDKCTYPDCYCKYMPDIIPKPINQQQIEKLAEESWNEFSVSIPEDAYSLEEYAERVAGKEIMYKDDFIKAIAGYTAAKDKGVGMKWISSDKMPDKKLLDTRFNLLLKGNPATGKLVIDHDDGSLTFMIDQFGWCSKENLKNVYWLDTSPSPSSPVNVLDDEDDDNFDDEPDDFTDKITEASPVAEDCIAVGLPTDAEVEKWFGENIINGCDAVSAIYEFRRWLKEYKSLNISEQQAATFEQFYEWINAEERSELDIFEWFGNPPLPDGGKIDWDAMDAIDWERIDAKFTKWFFGRENNPDDKDIVQWFKKEINKQLDKIS